MEKNQNFYHAAWYLISAANLIKKYKKEMANDLLDKADELTNEIEVNEEDNKEIENYEQKLREIS
jgi:hypothetical protein